MLCMLIHYHYSFVHYYIKLHYFTLSVTEDKPTLPKLLEMKVPLHVGEKYEAFGIHLLNDTTGGKMAFIKHDCGTNIESITHRILHNWLHGDGIQVTWESLILVLKKCEVSFLANQIETAYEIYHSPISMQSDVVKYRVQ